MYTPTSDYQWYTGLTSLGPTLVKSNLAFLLLFFHVSQLGSNTATLTHTDFAARIQWFCIVCKCVNYDSGLICTPLWTYLIFGLGLL